MEIKDVLKIIIDGKNTHFDENIVNAFMNISTLDILKVMLSDNKVEINQTEEILLKEFNLNKLYDILNNKKNIADKKQKKLVETFDKYYHYNS